VACDLWLVPLVDVLCHSPENPFAEELARYDKALTDAGQPPVPVYSYMPGLSGDVGPVACFDYDALHFLRRAYLLSLQGLEVSRRRSPLPTTPPWRSRPRPPRRPAPSPANTRSGWACTRRRRGRWGRGR